MNWISVPSPFAHIETWGATVGNMNYVMTHNHNHDKWAVSTRPAFTLGTEWLGVYSNRAEAEAACERHARGRVH